MGYCLALPTLAFVLPNKNISPLIKQWLPRRVVGTTLDRSYPSNEMIRPKDTIRVIQQMSAEEPTAILFITAYYDILFDNLNPQLRYFWAGGAKGLLNGAYVSKETKVYFVLGKYDATDKEFSTIYEAKRDFRRLCLLPKMEQKLLLRSCRRDSLLTRVWPIKLLSGIRLIKSLP